MAIAPTIRVRSASMYSVSVRSIGGSVLAMVMTMALAFPAAARPRREVSPISRDPVAPIAVVAPEHDTIPEDLVVPDAPPASPTPSAAPQGTTSATPPTEPQSAGSRHVVADDTEYIIDTSSSEALDTDVLAAASAAQVDPRTLHRKSRMFLGAGAPVLALGLAGMVGGSLLGQFEQDAEVDTAAWVSIMLGGAALVAVGIPLTVRGIVLGREARAGFAREASSARFVPSVTRTRAGTWTGGLAARF